MHARQTLQSQAHRPNDLTTSYLWHAEPTSHWLRSPKPDGFYNDISRSARRLSRRRSEISAEWLPKDTDTRGVLQTIKFFKTISSSKTHILNTAISTYNASTNGLCSRAPISRAHVHTTAAELFARVCHKTSSLPSIFI
jgi:hypothetical protein